MKAYRVKKTVLVHDSPPHPVFLVGCVLGVLGWRGRGGGVHMCVFMFLCIQRKTKLFIQKDGKRQNSCTKKSTAGIILVSNIVLDLHYLLATTSEGPWN
jgi:hypothetical protein